MNEVETIVNDYPWLLEVYQEIALYRNHPEEVLSLFSRTLREIDKNTMQYMIEMQEKQLKENAKRLEESDEKLKETDEKLKETNDELLQQKLNNEKLLEEIMQLRRQLEEIDN